MHYSWHPAEGTKTHEKSCRLVEVTQVTCTGNFESIMIFEKIVVFWNMTPPPCSFGTLRKVPEDYRHVVLVHCVRSQKTTAMRHSYFI
jgi:hypothetical protein